MAYGAASDGGGQYSGSSQFLMWERYLPHTWCSLDDSRAPPAYHVDTDKGFVYSVADEAFVCQKKNHFQVTVHVGAAPAETHYVHTASGRREVDHLLIKVFGVKVGQSSWLPTIFSILSVIHYYHHHPFIHLSIIYPSIHPPINPSIIYHSSSHPIINPSINLLSIYPSVIIYHPSMHHHHSSISQSLLSVIVHLPSSIHSSIHHHHHHHHFHTHAGVLP